MLTPKGSTQGARGWLLNNSWSAVSAYLLLLSSYLCIKPSFFSFFDKTWRLFWEIRSLWHPQGYHLGMAKDQLISKCLFAVFNFFQKMNEGNFLTNLFWRILLMIFFKNFFDESIDEVYDEFFDYFWFLLDFFLIYNLLTIPSFRIRVPSIMLLQ